MPADRETLARSVLALDTCGRGAHVALLANDDLRLASRSARKGEGVDVAGLVRELLEAAGIEVAQVDRIAVTTGPGSFTGVRVGLALVRGLAIVDRTQVVGYGSLALLARAAPEDCGPGLCALLDAGQEKSYVAAYRRVGADLEEIREPSLVSHAALAGLFGADLAGFVAVHTEEEPWISLEASHVAVPANRAGALARWARTVPGRAASEVLPTYVGASHAHPNRNRVARAGGIE